MAKRGIKKGYKFNYTPEQLRQKNLAISKGKKLAAAKKKASGETYFNSEVNAERKLKISYAAYVKRFEYLKANNMLRPKYNTKLEFDQYKEFVNNVKAQNRILKNISTSQQIADAQAYLSEYDANKLLKNIKNQFKNNELAIDPFSNIVNFNYRKMTRNSSSLGFVATALVNTSVDLTGDKKSIIKQLMKTHGNALFQFLTEIGYSYDEAREAIEGLYA